jgi:Cu2+-containing amine oxidase
MGGTPHPLDPLAAEEIGLAAAILRREQGVSERWRFASIELREPSKQTVRDFAAGDPIDRAAVVICWNRDDGLLYKAVVSLSDDRVIAWEHQPDGQPNMTVDEFRECDETLRRDPRVIEALARRGITDLDRVLIDTWAYGAHLVPEAHRGGRVGWADVWYRSQEGSSPYANPVTGLHFVDDRTYAPFHQHFLVARLDLDVDGEANTVYASESEALPIGPDNPHGLALVQRDTPLRTEQEGKQDYDWHSQRAWKVVNESVTNGLGTPVGYKLVPGGAFPPMMHPDSPVLRRAQAIGHTLWVTPFQEDERWPCGEFVVQSEEDRGLPVWTAQNRSIEDTDIVLWYVFGIHHITRPEEWPVMSVDTVSFWLKPTGFFDRNPALDVAPR